MLDARAVSHVRVRIAPSPTGEPHVGTAYVALLNLAFAKKRGGEFILRIEDTDRERSKPEWENDIIQGLKWLGLNWNEGPDIGGPYGPYRQSERQEIYREHAATLIENGHAYRCFCTRDRLDKLREKQKQEKSRLGYDRHCRNLDPKEARQKADAGSEFVVRMAVPLQGTTEIVDQLRGEVRFENTEIDDQVILKSDGYPTYHLANVVDDHLMGISHVIRAEEWINSTPKHLLLYRMFDWKAPEFIHLPLLRNADKSKISKRKNPVSVLDYRERGFLPQAVLNYLGLLGGTMPDETEVFDLDTFSTNFDFSKMSLGGPVFDLEKLTWLNGKYYREELSEAQLLEVIRSEVLGTERLARVVPLVRERIDKAEDFIAQTSYFFVGDIELDTSRLIPKKKSAQDTRKAFEKYAERIDRQADFSATALEEISRSFCEELEWKTRDFFMPLRIAVTGRKASPPLFDTMSVLGRALVRRRLRNAITLLKAAK